MARPWAHGEDSRREVSGPRLGAWAPGLGAEAWGLGSDIAGSARGALGEDFCQRRGVQKPMRFDVAAYGEEACGILAKGFCHRLQHFLNLELANPALVQAPFSPGALAAYQEPSEFIKLE